MDIGPLGPLEPGYPVARFTAAAQALLASPGSTDYSDGVSLALAEHALAAYLPAAEHRSAIAEQGWEGGVVSDGCAQVAIVVAPEFVVLACRGSSERGDWLTNGQLCLTEWRDVLPRGVEIHRGFRGQAERMRDELGVLLRAVVGPGAAARRSGYQVPVWITGHSLGGALASLLAPLLTVEAALVPSGVYTYSSPRVGKAPWLNHYTKSWGRSSHRVVPVDRGVTDLVTRVPLSAWGWRHVGRTTVIRDGYRVGGDEAWSKLRAADPVKPLQQWRIISRLRTGVASHSCARLVEHLRRVQT